MFGYLNVKYNMSELNYERVFNVLVDKTAEYVTSNNLKAMVLGISGGIDSTVVAAICHEVSKKTGIPLIGRSLPIKNKSDEFATSVHVGEAFCDKFEVYRLERSYRAALFDACADVNMANSYHLDELEEMPSRTPIANGNLQARCRMMYLYDIASRHKGLVMSTDNQTEYQLGFWTIHGDVGDFDPIQDLWKTEVYGLANYLQDHYKSKALEALRNDYKETCDNYKAMSCAIYNSCKLVPTDGLGISNSDLEQIGAKDYATVDDILQTATNNIFDSTGRWVQPLMEKYSEDVVVKVLSRHVASEFKRKKAPIYISRELYE
jgi:NAD+ synthetase